MKVELEQLRLAVTVVSEDIVVGIPAPGGSGMRHHKIVTNDFIDAMIVLLSPGPMEYSNPKTGEKWIVHLEKMPK